MTPAKRKAGSPKVAPMLTGDQLDQIKKKDIANLIGKVRQGKSLTAAERKILESAAGTDHVERELVSITRLAELFQVSRKTIYQWRNEGRQGVPEKVGTKEDVAAWRSWFAANPSAGHYDGKPRRDRETLLCEKLEIEIAIKQAEYQREIGELIPTAEVRESVIRVYSAVRAELLKLPSDCAPRIEGLSASAIQKFLREEIVAILTRLSDENANSFGNPSG
jgi:phage terminase Nu1 subunit (DNA packaging protein)